MKVPAEHLDMFAAKLNGTDEQATSRVLIRRARAEVLDIYCRRS